MKAEGIDVRKSFWLLTGTPFSGSCISRTSPSIWKKNKNKIRNQLFARRWQSIRKVNLCAEVARLRIKRAIALEIVPRCVLKLHILCREVFPLKDPGDEAPGPLYWCFRGTQSRYLLFQSGTLFAQRLFFFLMMGRTKMGRRHILLERHCPKINGKAKSCCYSK